MNAKELQKKLDKKTQELIEGVECPTCSNPIVYIRVQQHVDLYEYEMFETEKILTTGQSGERYMGYPRHICKQNKVMQKGFKSRRLLKAK